MIRVGVSVEGKTERNFVTAVMRPYLYKKGILIQPINIRGNVSIDRACREIKRLSHEFDFVTIFYDFYGFQGKKPGETKASLEQRLVERIDNQLSRRFIPYIQMYEFDGLLFSSPADLALRLKDDSIEAWANDILRIHNSNPEEINDSRDTAPSKRLGFKTIYSKTELGHVIAKDIGLEKIRKKCPGFGVWLEKIEGLACQ